jgi:hypothetical protein
MKLPINAWRQQTLMTLPAVPSAQRSSTLLPPYCHLSIWIFRGRGGTLKIFISTALQVKIWYIKINIHNKYEYRFSLEYLARKRQEIISTPRSCRSSSGWSLASHRGGPGSHVGFVVQKKRHWGRFPPSTSASPANHSTNFSIIIITRGWQNRPISGRSAEWTQLDSTPQYTNFKKISTPQCRDRLRQPLIQWDPGALWGRG